MFNKFDTFRYNLDKMYARSTLESISLAIAIIVRTGATDTRARRDNGICERLLSQTTTRTVNSRSSADYVMARLIRETIGKRDTKKLLNGFYSIYSRACDVHFEHRSTLFVCFSYSNNFSVSIAIQIFIRTPRVQRAGLIVYLASVYYPYLLVAFIRCL